MYSILSAQNLQYLRLLGMARFPGRGPLGRRGCLRLGLASFLSLFSAFGALTLQVDANGEETDDGVADPDPAFQFPQRDVGVRQDGENDLLAVGMFLDRKGQAPPAPPVHVGHLRPTFLGGLP